MTSGPVPSSVASTASGTARERLLDAADELFYEEGVHTVGIDRIIERAGVAKATLYSTFGSKEELIRAYLQRRDRRRRDRLLAVLQRHQDPRDQLLGMFDALATSIAEPGFRGCAFVNASAECQPGGAIEAVSDQSRSWLRSLFVDLSRSAGAADPDLLGRQLAMLYEGASVSARMDHDPTAAGVARAVAETLIDADFDHVGLH